MRVSTTQTLGFADAFVIVPSIELDTLLKIIDWNALRKIMHLITMIKYFFQANSHLSVFWQNIIDFLYYSIWAKGSSSIIRDIQTNPGRFSEKQSFLTECKEKPTIFFTFRDSQWIEWFAPVERVLSEGFPELRVILLNYGSSLKRVGRGKKLLEHRRRIEEKMTILGIPKRCLFFNEECSLYPFFPSAEIIVATENIRQEQLPCQKRVYLPHYFILKATDSFTENPWFQHLLVPSKLEYFYPLQANETFTRHETGMPKLLLQTPQKKITFLRESPVIIFAPSLEIEILNGYIQNGIIDLFAKLDPYQIIIKLHPSLFSRRKYVTDLFESCSKGFTHIHFEVNTTIQELYECSDLMIADYGSSGAEYKLGCGKPVIFLSIPESYECPSLSSFKSKFADAEIDLSDLENTLKHVLALPPMQQETLNRMRNNVLHSYHDSDFITAKTLASLIPSKI